MMSGEYRSIISHGLWTDVDFDAVIFFELIVTRASGSISMNFLY
jgi:hypothetical protein